MPTDPILLQDIPCFRDLTDDQMKAIAEIANAVCYPPGYVLFEEGKPGECLFFLVKGDVEVLYNIGEAGQVRVETISGKEIVGCSALAEPYAYTATERSLTEIEVLEIKVDALRELMREDCSLGLVIQQYVMKILMDRIIDFRLGSLLPGVQPD